MDLVFPTQEVEEGFYLELQLHRDNLILLRDKALMQNNFEWAVALSHTIAFVSGLSRRELTIPAPDPEYNPYSMDAQHDGILSALLGVRTAITGADPNILTDTLWMPDGSDYKGGTVVDFIDQYLPESLRRAAEKAQETS